MGYYINLMSVDWKIHTSSAEPIMEEIKQLNSKREFSWVTTEALEEAENFIDFMNELRYQVSQQEDFFILEDFDGEKLGDDEQIFVILAKYSNPGNYIKFQGENSEAWYWTVTDRFTLEEDLIDLSELDWRENKYEDIDPYADVDESEDRCDGCFYDKCQGCIRDGCNEKDCYCPCDFCEKGSEFKPFE